MMVAVGTGSAAVAQLAAAVDELLAVDPSSLADDDVHEVLLDLARQEARLAAVRARLLPRWERGGAWSGDGARSSAAALARDTMCSPSSAAREVRRARALVTMPATWAALAAGRFSVDYVDVLARANQPWRHAVFADHEATLVEQCAGLRYFEAVRAVKYWCQHADAIAADEQAEHHRHRAHLHASRTLDGTVVVNGVLDPVGGAVVVNELERLERELRNDARRAGVARTRSQLRAAALVEMARRSSGATGTPGRP